MALSKRSDTVVVDELLAFVQNKLDVMDVVSLEQICLTSYSDVDIYTAMVHLNETAEPKHVRLTMRNKEGSGKKNIRDIFRVFQNEDPDDVPTYVARDLNKLPPVTFDHVDVTTLLKDIVLLKSDMKDLKQKWETAEQVSAELRRELSSLREQNAASATPPAACVNMQRGAAVQHETAPVSDSTRPATLQQPDTLRVSDPAADRKSDNNMPPPSPPRPEPALHPDAAPFVPGKQKDVPRQKTRRPRRKRQPTPPVTLKGKQTTSTAANENNAASKAIVDEDGFIMVEPRKRQFRRNRNKRGTVTAASTTLKAAEPIAQLYVSRLDIKTTPEDILQHLQKMVKVNQEPARIPAGLTLGIRQLESKINSYLFNKKAKLIFAASANFETRGSEGYKSSILSSMRDSKARVVNVFAFVWYTQLFTSTINVVPLSNMVAVVVAYLAEDREIFFFFEWDTK
ncbi:hypothetical protein NE865_12381 [Phthorimaea operculella]|nr:hypothetical protein NE865_12381 [Phthorimaea operculella]